MTSQWQPYREPLSTTLLRTGAIAVILGAVIALRRGGISQWPMATLLALWLTFGGHWMELWFLNWLRPRISSARLVQIAARVTTWFIGGIMLAFCMRVTATALAGSSPARWPTWWFGGLAFIGIELLVHLVLQLRGARSFYNGRG
jgi:hypothetical protein